MILDIYNIPLIKIDGSETTLAQDQNKFLIIINTASKCRFTPQYAEFQALYEKYRGHLLVLAFPCNQFLKQESGSSQEIQEFCSLHYQVTFPIFQKIDVNGPKTHELYKRLKPALPGLMGTKNIKWNFTKFLIAPNGEGLKRFAPQDKAKKIEKYLKNFLDLKKL